MIENRDADRFAFDRPVVITPLGALAPGFAVAHAGAVDDIALPIGTIRIRAKGSDGGHNGLRNISEVLGTNEYARLRFGIGDNFHKGFQVDYVKQVTDIFHEYHIEPNSIITKFDLKAEIEKELKTRKTVT